MLINHNAEKITPTEQPPEPIAQPIDTWGEAWRHACEVRWVAALPTIHARRAYLEGIEQRRGKPAATRLRDDIAAMWAQRIRPDPHQV